jgi:teichuronic acid biosynthesis glycosyltransferase TuaC
MVIKEAMACGLPIVSVDVGDVKERIDGVNNCFIVAQSADAIASKVKYLIENTTSPTNGLEILKLQGLDNRSIARKVEEIYNDAIREK